MAVGLVFNQMGAKAGVKRYENKAIVEECKQLYLTQFEQKRALRSITLVKEKRCSKSMARQLLTVKNNESTLAA